MNRIVSIAANSQQYINNLNNNIVRVITANQNEIITINQQQMLLSTDAEGNPLINRNTGSELLSPLYALKKNKPKPDLSDTESFQNKMFFKMDNIKEHFINSADFKAGKLVQDYGKIFGIAPGNRPAIQEKNDSDIINDYLSKTIRK